jgi:hypothetical protein
VNRTHRGTTGSPGTQRARFPGGDRALATTSGRHHGQAIRIDSFEVDDCLILGPPPGSVKARRRILALRCACKHAQHPLEDPAGCLIAHGTRSAHLCRPSRASSPYHRSALRVALLESPTSTSTAVPTPPDGGDLAEPASNPRGVPTLALHAGRGRRVARGRASRRRAARRRIPQRPEAQPRGQPPAEAYPAASSFFTRMLYVARCTQGPMRVAEWRGEAWCVRRWQELVRPDGFARLEGHGGYLRFRTEDVAAWLDTRADAVPSDTRGHGLRPRPVSSRTEGTG